MDKVQLGFGRAPASRARRTLVTPHQPAAQRERHAPSVPFSAVLGFLALAFAFACPLLASEAKKVDELRAKAQAGDSEAMFLLALRYDNGEGVELDRAVAASWYLRSAQAGFAEAQNSIGSLYQAGEGVEQSFPEALAWYQKASHQGHPEATHNLACLYDEGKGTPEDNTRAFDLYTRAAEKGFVASMVNLAIMHSQGDGVPTSAVEAYKWLDLARFYTQRSKDRQLKWHVRGLLDKQKRTMSPIDIRTAEELARAWDQVHRK